METKSQFDHLSDQEMSRHFMPRLAVPEHERWLSQDVSLTVAAKKRMYVIADQRYGSGPRQLADIFPARDPGSAALVFFHGGYWRALSKDHVGYIAWPLAEAGIATIFPSYDLCPGVGLAEIVRQAAEAVAFAIKQAPRLNVDPARIYVGGNSAGAHLAAMMLALESNGELGASEKVAGAVLVTGIYDLHAVRRIQVNDDVRLSEGDAAQLSPLLLPILGPGRALVAVGAMEPPLWVNQSRQIAAKLRTDGYFVEMATYPRHHHFSITRSLSDADAPLTRSVIEFIR